MKKKAESPAGPLAFSSAEAQSTVLLYQRDPSGFAAEDDAPPALSEAERVVAEARVAAAAGTLESARAQAGLFGKDIPPEGVVVGTPSTIATSGTGGGGVVRSASASASPAGAGAGTQSAQQRTPSASAARAGLAAAARSSTAERMPGSSASSATAATDDSPFSTARDQHSNHRAIITTAAAAAAARAGRPIAPSARHLQPAVAADPRPLLATSRSAPAPAGRRASSRLSHASRASVLPRGHSSADDEDPYDGDVTLEQGDASSLDRDGGSGSGAGRRGSALHRRMTSSSPAHEESVFDARGPLADSAGLAVHALGMHTVTGSPEQRHVSRRLSFGATPGMAGQGAEGTPATLHAGSASRMGSGRRGGGSGGGLPGARHISRRQLAANDPLELLLPSRLELTSTPDDRAGGRGRGRDAHASPFSGFRRSRAGAAAADDSVLQLPLTLSGAQWGSGHADVESDSDDDVDAAASGLRRHHQQRGGSGAGSGGAAETGNGRRRAGDIRSSPPTGRSGVLLATGLLSPPSAVIFDTPLTTGAHATASPRLEFPPRPLDTPARAAPLSLGQSPPQLPPGVGIPSAIPPFPMAVWASPVPPPAGAPGPSGRPLSASPSAPSPAPSAPAATAAALAAVSTSAASPGRGGARSAQPFPTAGGGASAKRKLATGTSARAARAGAQAPLAPRKPASGRLSGMARHSPDPSSSAALSADADADIDRQSSPHAVRFALPLAHAHPLCDAVTSASSTAPPASPSSSSAAAAAAVSASAQFGPAVNAASRAAAAAAAAPASQRLNHRAPCSARAPAPQEGGSAHLAWPPHGQDAPPGSPHRWTTSQALRDDPSSPANPLRKAAQAAAAAVVAAASASPPRRCSKRLLSAAAAAAAAGSAGAQRSSKRPRAVTAPSLPGPQERAHASAEHPPLASADAEASHRAGPTAGAPAADAAPSSAGPASDSGSPLPSAASSPVRLHPMLGDGSAASSPLRRPSFACPPGPRTAADHLPGASLRDGSSPLSRHPALPLPAGGAPLEPLFQPSGRTTPPRAGRESTLPQLGGSPARAFLGASERSALEGLDSLRSEASPGRRLTTGALAAVTADEGELARGARGGARERLSRNRGRPGSRQHLPGEPGLTPTGVMALPCSPQSRELVGPVRRPVSRLGHMDAYAAAQRQRAIESQLVAARHSATLDSVTRTPAGRSAFGGQRHACRTSGLGAGIAGMTVSFMADMTDDAVTGVAMATDHGDQQSPMAGPDDGAVDADARAAAASHGDAGSLPGRRRLPDNLRDLIGSRAAAGIPGESLEPPAEEASSSAAAVQLETTALS